MLERIFSQEGREVSCKAGDYVFLQGDADRFVYLVEEGMLKAAYLRFDGREHIKTVLLPGASIGSLVALTGAGACSFSLQAIEDSRLRAVPYAAVKQAAEEDAAAAQQVMALLTDLALRKEKREYELLCLSAEERYRRFMDELGHVAARLSQMDIAAYLGITPPALSRMKRRMRQNSSTEGS